MKDFRGIFSQKKTTRSDSIKSFLVVYLSPALLETLFAEVGSVAERQKLVRLIFDVIRSDGHLADGEARLIWHALDTWRLRLDDGIGYRPHAAAFRQRGRQRQTEFKAMSSRG